jgi:hypothetical protein
MTAVMYVQRYLLVCILIYLGMPTRVPGAFQSGPRQRRLPAARSDESCDVLPSCDASKALPSKTEVTAVQTLPSSAVAKWVIPQSSWLRMS